MDDTTNTATPLDQAANVATSSITIQGLLFEVDRPYVPGQIDLTAGEAHALNQTRAENLRNNFAPVIKTAIEAYRKANNLAADAEVPVGELDKEELDTEFAKYCDEYEFGLRSGGPRTPMDPVEREATKIAVEKLKQAFAKQNPPIKVSSVSKEKLAEMAKAVIAKYPEILAEAHRRVDNVAAIAIDSLGV